ncbi:hypothetical protein ACFXPD_22225, partial [Streptomyces goshikiensis]
MEGKRHPHAHPHTHHHGHDAHGPGGTRPAPLPHRLAHRLRPHGHEPSDKVDTAMETSREGMRTLWLSLLVLGLTTAVQAVITALSGSVALLGDTIHNATDALTAVPLGIAFLLGRRGGGPPPPHPPPPPPGPPRAGVGGGGARAPAPAPPG